MVGNSKLLRIDSLDKYLCEVFSMAKENDNLKYTRNNLLFRGHSDKAFELQPSIGRGRKYSLDKSILNQERNLIELAKYRFPDVFSKDLEPVELLALLQHYGIPTRLLDVTSNALVAMYFACMDDEKDGEVFVFEASANDVVTYPILNAIADSYRFLNFTWSKVEDFYDKASSQPYFNEQSRMMVNGSEVVNWIKGVCNSPLFVYAPIHSNRQLIQKGQYILFPNQLIERSGSAYFGKVINSIDKNADFIVRRFIIRKPNKKTIRKQLKLCGIDRGILFADSIDAGCAQILEDCQSLI